MFQKIIKWISEIISSAPNISTQRGDTVKQAIRGDNNSQQSIGYINNTNFNATNQVNGSNNNVFINEHSNNISLAHIQALLETPECWSYVDNSQDYEFISNVDARVSISFTREPDNCGRTFINDIWADKSSEWRKLYININSKSIYSDSYCSLDGGLGPTIVDPEFIYLKPIHKHENVRFFYYIDPSIKTTINKFLGYHNSYFGDNNKSRLNKILLKFNSTDELKKFTKLANYNRHDIQTHINNEIGHYKPSIITDEYMSRYDRVSAKVIAKLYSKWRSSK